MSAPWAEVPLPSTTANLSSSLGVGDVIGDAVGTDPDEPGPVVTPPSALRVPLWVRMGVPGTLTYEMVTI